MAVNITVYLSDVMAMLTDEEKTVLARTVLHRNLTEEMVFTEYVRGSVDSEHFNVRDTIVLYHNLEDMISIERVVRPGESIATKIYDFIHSFLNMKKYTSSKRFNARIFQGLEQDIVYYNNSTGESDIVRHLSAGKPARCSDVRYTGDNVIVVLTTIHDLNITRELFPNVQILMHSPRPRLIESYEVYFDNDDRLILNKRNDFDLVEYLVALTNSSIKRSVN